VQVSDLALAKRLERAEGHACMQFAMARRRLFPNCVAEWMEYGGAYVAFDGVDSPITQTFGLGLFEELSSATLDSIEQFFHERSAPVYHEVSPLVGVPALQLLCERGYRPVEVSSVMYQPVHVPPSGPPEITVRVTGPDEAQVWNDISIRAWSHDHPELAGFLGEMGAVWAARQYSPCFLAEIDGVPGASASLFAFEGVAVFAGAATVAEMRRRGLQSALIRERMRYASEHGCDLAVMIAEAGSESQRNAERRGFRIAYTRTKWRLFR